MIEKQVFFLDIIGRSEAFSEHRFQAGSAFLTTETSIETTPKWHGFLMIKLAAFQASGWARMKLRLAGTVNRLNVDTSNISFFFD